MKSKEDRIADDGRRIVDLVIVQKLDAPPLHLVQQARLGEGREHSAVPVGARAQRAYLQTGSNWPVPRHGRHVALLEEKDVAGRQAEGLVLMKKCDRFFMRGVAGHDEVGDRFPARRERAKSCSARTWKSVA